MILGYRGSGYLVITILVSVLEFSPVPHFLYSFLVMGDQQFWFDFIRGSTFPLPALVFLCRFVHFVFQIGGCFLQQQIFGAPFRVPGLQLLLQLDRFLIEVVYSFLDFEKTLQNDLVFFLVPDFIP